jgi:probable HAF family extracellular repeat protein
MAAFGNLGSTDRAYDALVGMNASGLVAGNSFTARGKNHACVWQKGVITDLGTLGGDGSDAAQINDAGQVIGTAATAAGDSRAYLWEKGTMTDLGTFGGKKSAVAQINSAGQVIGTAQTAGGAAHAYLWDKGALHDLGTLGGGQSEALAINDAGQIVGDAQTAAGDWHAVLWQSGTMTDLGLLKGGTASVAYLINAQGDILGQALTGKLDAQGTPVVHDVVWSKGSMIDLTNLLPDPTAWQTDGNDVTAMNNHGQVVLSATYGSKQRIFFFSPTP